MPFEILVTRDYDHMSEAAAAIVKAEIRRRLRQKERCVLGLATGWSPAGMYKHLAKAANRGHFDSRRLVSFNLDEYVGLPGENAQQRALHRESYSFYMVRDFFGLLRSGIGEANVPWGTLIDQKRLIRALKENPGDWREQGNPGGSEGKAIVIRPGAGDEYLRRVRREILDGYARKMKRRGGVDLQVIGVGSRGHVAFHEVGIPFKGNRMLLVKLDGSTIANAIKDGHFASRAESPLYAISMGVELVFQAPTVVLLASGARKVAALERSIFDKAGPDLPLSYIQQYVKDGGKLYYVVDRSAAAGILKRRAGLTKKGIKVRNASEEGATVMVNDIHFHCDSATGLMA